MGGIAAGKYRHVANIEAPVPAPGLGEAPTWAVWVPGVWCSITPISAGEAARAMQLTGTVTHRVRLRHFPGLNTAHQLRIIAGPVDEPGTNRTFTIRSVIDREERREEYELLCEEVTVGVPTTFQPEIVVPDTVPLLSQSGAPLLSPDGSPLSFQPS